MGSKLFLYNFVYIYFLEMINFQKVRKNVKDREYCDQIVIYRREGYGKKGNFRSKIYLYFECVMIEEFWSQLKLR